MRVAFRVDASLQIGTGHVMRCLTLAGEFWRLGANVVFICREHPGNLCNHIEAMGFEVYRLPWSANDENTEQEYDMDTQPPHANWLGTSWQKDADETISTLLLERIDSLVVDHFAIDARWERKVRDLASVKIGIIDGQLDRAHYCDFLLDPNLTPNAEFRWKALVPCDCRLFLGPRFAFLNSEFIEERENLRTRDGYIKSILVSFGGVDRNNATAKALRALSKIDISAITVDVVIGPGNPYKEELECSWAHLPNVNIHFQPSNMAKLMSKADLAIGAGGIMAWERCSLGLPTIILGVADNQQENCLSIAREEAGIYLGKLEEVDIRSIVDSITFMLYHPDEVSKMAKNSMKIMKDSGSGLKEFCKAIIQ